MKNGVFGALFKKFRLKSEFLSLSDLARTLADEGLVYEESTLSRWQSGNRIPLNRNLLVLLIKIFIKRGGIRSLQEANRFLESASHGYLTEGEMKEISDRLMSASQPKFIKKMVDFLAVVGKSKRLQRAGWVREKIKNSESVAEHSFRVGVLAMVIADSLGSDKEKLIKMALVHDLGEVATGDLVWSRGEIIDIKKRIEKEKLEKKGIFQLFNIIGQANEYQKIYLEMIERKSLEANIFWQLDKIEMAMQALEYENDQGKRLDEFFINADLQVTSSLLRTILNKIKKLRHPQGLNN